MLLLGGSVLCLHRPVPSESNAKLAISFWDTSWLDGSGFDLEIRYRPGIGTMQTLMPCREFQQRVVTTTKMVRWMQQVHMCQSCTQECLYSGDCSFHF